LKSPNNRIIKNDTIKTLFQTALAEMSVDRYCSKEYLEMLFSLILIQLIRTLKQQNIDYSTLPSKNEELCYQIMHYIDTNIFSFTSFESLSEIFNYDYKYLTYIFTKTTKQTLSNYVRLKRLEKACELLKSSKYSLTEISEKLHYSSLYAFSKAFKKHYGLSPKNYLQNSTTIQP
jgi:AraC-like DNA-binding protein